jgi:hypothetical protein
MNCRRRIDENDPFVADELEKVWDRLQRLVAERASGDPDPSLAHCIAGIAAVLLLLHADWLNTHEGRWAGCVAVVDEVSQNPPPRPVYDVEGSLYSTGWDRFAAEVAAVEWARVPTNIDARIRSANAVASFHHEALGHLLRQVIKRRDAIGTDDVSRLIQLTVRFAGLRRRSK